MGDKNHKGKDLGELKLPIELVPRTCFESNLRSILPREGWDKLRKISYRDARYRCEICGGRGPKHPVECHEIWAYVDRTHVQRLEGLQSLCPNCHMVKHFGLAMTRGYADVAFGHFCKINKLERDAAEAHITFVFDVWEERSKHEWIQDLSFIKRFGLEVPAPERLAVSGLAEDVRGARTERRAYGKRISKQVVTTST